MYAARHCCSPICLCAVRGDNSLPPEPCHRRRALHLGAGRRVPARAPVRCVECGISRRKQPRTELWLRDWDGEPTCSECLDLLELRAELLGFAQLTMAEEAIRLR